MMRRILMIGVLTALVLGVVPVSAHDDFRIIGTISRAQASQIQVKTREGKTTAIRLDTQTLITRDKKKVAASELRTGQSVVVDALGDSEADLLALEVRIVPAIAPSADK